jgi:hypothetical protein
MMDTCAWRHLGDQHTTRQQQQTDLDEKQRQGEDLLSAHILDFI